MLEIYHFSNKVTNSIVIQKQTLTIKQSTRKQKQKQKKIGKESFFISKLPLRRTLMCCGRVHSEEEIKVFRQIKEKREDGLVAPS
jgi:hypothetical protein